MNKWMKNSLTAMAVTAASISASMTDLGNGQPLKASTEEQLIDALDFAGGSKLKDRRCLHSDKDQDLEIVVVMG